MLQVAEIEYNIVDKGISASDKAYDTADERVLVAIEGKIVKIEEIRRKSPKKRKWEFNQRLNGNNVKIQD